MPNSMVLHIKTMEDCSGKQLHGGIAQAALVDFLRNYMKEYDPAQAEKIIQDYTFSPLYIGERSPRPLSVSNKEDTLCWFRISCLDERSSEGVFNHLYRDIVTNQISTLTTESGSFKVLRAISNPSSKHPWVNNISIDTLYQNASHEENESLIDFASPTVFVYNGLMMPLPIPQLVYSHIGKTWNRISGKYGIPENVLEDLSNKVTIVAFKNLSTNIHLLAKGKVRVGFIGKVRFRLIGTNDPEMIKIFNFLSDAVFYTGLGKDTDMGCGMARRIPRNKWELLREGFK